MGADIVAESCGIVNPSSGTPVSPPKQATEPLKCDLLLSLVNEAWIMIRYVCSIVEEGLDKVSTLAEAGLEKEVVNGLEQYRQCVLDFHATNESDIKINRLASSAWHLCRTVSIHHPALAQFITGKCEDPGLFMFNETFEKFRSLVVKRLTTTLEEESAIQAYLDEVFRREDKAMKDHTALVQQLEMERAERHKAFEQYQDAVRAFNEETQAEKDRALAEEQDMQSNFDSVEADEYNFFIEREKRLSEECIQLKCQLAKMQTENRTLELTARGKKEQSSEEVRSSLQDYQEAIAGRQEDLSNLIEKHNAVDERYRFLKGYYDEKARLEKQRQDEERALSEAKAKEERRQGEAAKRIQRVWRKFHRKKVEERKKLCALDPEFPSNVCHHKIFIFSPENIVVSIW